ADQCGDDVRTLQVEIVARPVEVYGQDVNSVEAVLRPVGLELHHEQLLGQAVGGVRLLGVAIPQGRFLERHRCKLRVGADRSYLEVLEDAELPAGFDELAAHDQVLIEETAGTGPVGADAAHDRRQVEDNLGTVARQHSLNIRFTK